MTNSRRLMRRKKHRNGDLAIFVSYIKEPHKRNFCRSYQKRYPVLYMYRIGEMEFSENKNALLIRTFQVMNVEFSLTKGISCSYLSDSFDEGFDFNKEEKCFYHKNFIKSKPPFKYIGSTHKKIHDFHNYRDARDFLCSFRHLL